MCNGCGRLEGPPATLEPVCRGGWPISPPLARFTVNKLIPTNADLGRCPHSACRDACRHLLRVSKGSFLHSPQEACQRTGCPQDSLQQGNPKSSSETEKVRRGGKADVCLHCAGWKSRRERWGIPRITFSPGPDGREGPPTAVCRGAHLSLRRGSRGAGPQRPPPSRRLSHPSLGGTGRRLGELREVLWRSVKPWVVPAHHRQRDWSWHRTQPRSRCPSQGAVWGAHGAQRTFTGLC